jgi:hypothetical protein
MGYEEKRKGKEPVPVELLESLNIPKKLLKYMNEEQRHTYLKMQLHGWKLKFIRRPLSQKPICVFTDANETSLAVIENDGTFNKYPDIPLRSAKNRAKE